MSAQPAAAETVGNYIIERSLAQGSMGHVYVARHQLTYALVALKVLRAELATDAQSEERFLREVRSAAQIGHEGIVKVLDAGRDAQGRLYLAMELLSGETLEERMAREPNQRLALMRWVASALPPLAAAHAQGIVHRDLKPANLFIARAADGSEQLKLLDFGLARDTRQKSRTETGVALGTPYYMSPEQAIRPKEVGPASDVWALGVMMYEVLSGHMPFDGETLHAVVLQSTTRPHVPLATHRPELDPTLCELVEECLQKEPDARPHDASALLARLYPLLADEHICRQLDAPISMAQLAHGARNVDQISYADTAITLPAPRLDESEASYAPRRRAQSGALMPITLTALLLGAGAFGYLKYAPTSRASTAPATAVLPSQSPTPTPATTPAAVSGEIAPLTPTTPKLEPTPTAPAVAEEDHTEGHASTLREARGSATKLTSTARRQTRGKKPEPTHALPNAAAREPSELPRAETEPEQTEEARLEQEPLPAPPPKDAPWDQAQVDSQLQDPQDQGQVAPPQAAVDTNPQPPATAEPSPAVGPEGSIEAPAAPVPEVDSLPPPEPPASP